MTSLSQTRTARLNTFHTPEADRKLNRLLAGELDRALMDFMDAQARQESLIEQIERASREVARMQADGTWNDFAASGGLIG